MALRPWVTELGKSFRVHFDLGDLTPDKKKDDPLKVAKVLEKVLKNDRLDEEAKERARQWVARAANDPMIRRMFRESSEPGMESFLSLAQADQQNIIVGIKKPVFTQFVEFMKNNFNDENFPETLKMLNQRAEKAEKRQRKRKLSFWEYLKILRTREGLEETAMRVDVGQETENKLNYEDFQKQYPEVTREYEEYNRKLRGLLLRIKPLIYMVEWCAGCERKFPYIQRVKNRWKVGFMTMEQRKKNPAILLHESCIEKFMEKDIYCELAPEGQHIDRIWLVPDDEESFRTRHYFIKEQNS